MTVFPLRPIIHFVPHRSRQGWWAEEPGDRFVAQAEAPTLAELKRKVERDLWRRYRQGSLKDVYGDTFPEIV